MAKNRNPYYKVTPEDDERLYLRDRIRMETFGLYCALRNMAHFGEPYGFVTAVYGRLYRPNYLRKSFRFTPKRWKAALDHLRAHGVIASPSEWIKEIEETKDARLIAAAKAHVVDAKSIDDDMIVIPALAEQHIRSIVARELGRSGTNVDDGLTARQRRNDRVAAARKLGGHTEEQWLKLCELFEFRCVRCLAHVSALRGDQLTKDHVQPLRESGSDAIENIQPLCKHCNLLKESEVDRRDWRDDFHDRLAHSLRRPE
jgi:5-methylcytosine-specific restriction endonuclease McrA